MRIRVLQVGKFYPPENGGIETITRQLTEPQNEKYDTDVLCFSTSVKTTIDKVGTVTIIRSGSLFTIASSPISLSYFYYFKKIRNNYNIIHIHHPNPLGILCALIFKSKGKIVLHWHSDILNKGIFYKFFSPIEKKLLKKADVIVATSPVYIEESVALEKFLHKCTVIPGAIMEDSLTSDPQNVNDLKKQFGNKKIVFTIGRHVEYKGFNFLIQAATSLPNDTIVVIGGDGPLFNHHMELIKAKGLEKKVILTGRIPAANLGNYYAACDVFCLPSCHKSEAFGLVILEAMRFSKPVVATKIPGSGVSWVNEHEVTGLNAENKNPESLAAAIKYLLSNDDLRLKYGENAYARFKQFFTDEQMRRQFADLYVNISNNLQ